MVKNPLSVWQLQILLAMLGQNNNTSLVHFPAASREGIMSIFKLGEKTNPQCSPQIMLFI